MWFSEGIDSAKTARSEQMLIIGDEALQEMTAHAEEGYPHEVCGLLLGEVDAASSLRRVRQAKRARNLNLERAHARYELDPTDYLRIENTVPDRKTRIVTYCAGGNRSLLAAESLQRLGYECVASMVGGFTSWRNEGREFTTPRLLQYDALRAEFVELKIRRDPQCPYCGDGTEFPGFVDYEAFCAGTTAAGS